MSVLVKICGLKTAADVAFAVAAGAEALGFVFAESPRRVTAAAAARACSDLHCDVRKVAVMHHPTNAQWQEVLLDFRPDCLQTDSEDFAALDVPDTVQCLPVIREGNALLESDLPDVFLYEGASSGKGEVVNWQTAAAVAARGRLILAGGLHPGNVAAAIGSVRPFGVDVSSGVEETPGSKSPELIKAFIQAVRAAEQDL